MDSDLIGAYDKFMTDIISTTTELLRNIHPWIGSFLKAGGIVFGGVVQNAISAAIKHPNKVSTDARIYLENYLRGFGRDKPGDIDIIWQSKSISEAFFQVSQIVGEDNITCVEHKDYGDDSNAHYHVRTTLSSILGDEIPLVFDITVALSMDQAVFINPRFSIENCALSGDFELDLMYKSYNCKSIEQAIRHNHDGWLLIVDPISPAKDPNCGHRPETEKRFEENKNSGNAATFIKRVMRKIRNSWTLIKDDTTNNILVERIARTLYKDKTLKDDPVFYKLASSLDLKVGGSVSTQFRDVEIVREYLDKYSIVYNFDAWRATQDFTEVNAEQIGYIAKHKPEILEKIANSSSDSDVRNLVLYGYAIADLEEEFYDLLSRMGIDMVQCVYDNHKDSYYNRPATAIDAVATGARIVYYQMLVERGFVNLDYSHLQGMIRHGNVDTIKYLTGTNVVGNGGGTYRSGSTHRPPRSGEVVIVDRDIILNSIGCPSPAVIKYVMENFELDRYELIKYAESSKLDDLTEMLQLLRKRTKKNCQHPEVFGITRGVIKSKDFKLIAEYFDYLCEGVTNPAKRIRDIKYYKEHDSGSYRRLIVNFYEYFVEYFDVFVYCVQRFPDFIPRDFDRLLSKLKKHSDRRKYDPVVMPALARKLLRSF